MHFYRLKKKYLYHYGILLLLWVLANIQAGNASFRDRKFFKFKFLVHFKIYLNLRKSVEKIKFP